MHFISETLIRQGDKATIKENKGSRQVVVVVAVVVVVVVNKDTNSKNNVCKLCKLM